MSQQYVVVNREVKEAGEHLIGDLQDLIPEVRVVEKRGNLYLLEAPIHEEICLFEFFENRPSVISRKRTYELLATDRATAPSSEEQS